MIKILSCIIYLLKMGFSFPFVDKERNSEYVTILHCPVHLFFIKHRRLHANEKGYFNGHF
jgi:hypothetical protein